MATSINGYNCNGVNDNSPEFHEVEIPVPWGHISGKWWGSRETQPILSIHGWQDNAGTFDNLAPHLTSQGFSLLCIDLPGHGRSSHYPPGVYYYVFWDGVHLVRRIVKHYGWKDVVLMGHSLGGAISFLYASVFSEDVKKYISIDIVSPTVRDPVLNVKLGASIDKFLSYEKLTKENVPSYTYEEMLDLVKQAYGKSASRESCGVLMRRGMVPSESGGYHFARDLRVKVSALGSFALDQIMAFAKNIHCEVLNIRGDPGLTFDKPEYYNLVLDEVERHAKRVERHIIKGYHHLHMDDASTVASCIVPFLKS